MYDNNCDYDEKATLIACWEDIAIELIAQDFFSLADLIHFYSTNQKVIVEAFVPNNTTYKELFMAMTVNYGTEATMACMAAFAAYHWSYGCWYRAKRLEKLAKQ